jgi:hypothetical protein
MFKLKHKNNTNLHNTQRSHQLPEPHSAAAPTAETKKNSSSNGNSSSKNKNSSSSNKQLKTNLEKTKKIYTVTLAHKPQS